MQTVRKIIRYTAWALPAVVALALLLILPHFPTVTEAVFSGGLYRALSAVLCTLVGLLPFSLTELCVVAALPVAVLLVVLLIRALRRAESRIALLGRVARGLGWVLSCTLLLYMLMHGVNFYRVPLSERMGLDTSQKSPAFLQEVCILVADELTTLRAQLAEDENGCMQLSKPLYDTLQLGDECYANLRDTYPYLSTFVHTVKPVLLSHYWSYTGIAGMYFPMFSESNINIDMPVNAIPATVTHEIGHTCGYAREEDCNFLSFLACLHSDSVDYRYSGYLLAYTYCGNALYDYDQDMWAETRAHLSEGVKRDLRQRNEYWKQFETPVKDVSTNINDGFLTIQGQEDGVLSYGRVVELILGYYAAQ